MGGEGVDWQIETRGVTLVASPTGRVDEATATSFSERLSWELETASTAGQKAVVLNLAGINYMSSRGLRALTLAQRLAGEHDMKMVLAQPNPIMREILAISRYDLVFDLFDTVDDAVE